LNEYKILFEKEVVKVQKLEKEFKAKSSELKTLNDESAQLKKA